MKNLVALFVFFIFYLPASLLARENENSENLYYPYSNTQLCQHETGYLSCNDCNQVFDCLDLVPQNQQKNNTTLFYDAGTRENGTKFSFLPDKDLFRPLVASPREPQFSARYEKNNTQIDGSFTASVNSFGDYLPIFEYELSEDRALQFSVDGAFYAIFNLDTPSLDLFNTDFITGFSLSYKQNDSLTYRFRLFHVSSHLGDEFVLANPEVERTNSSYEDFRIVAAYALGDWRLYGGGGHIVRSDSELEGEPWSMKGGVEFRMPTSYSNVDILMALELESVQRMNWRLNRSVLAGVVFLQSEVREVRLMGNYYNGGSQHGQFFRESLEYYGLGFYFVV